MTKPAQQYEWVCIVQSTMALEIFGYQLHHMTYMLGSTNTFSFTKVQLECVLLTKENGPEVEILEN